jgi:hypothetical protein
VTILTVFLINFFFFSATFMMEDHDDGAGIRISFGPDPGPTDSLGAAVVALVLWLVPTHKAPENPLTPIQIAEGIQQMMLLEIGDIDSIVATPKDSYAILTARLKDGSTCSYILKCNDAEGTTTLLAYTNNK